MAAQFLLRSIRGENPRICQKVKDDLRMPGQRVSCRGGRIWLAVGGDRHHLLGGLSDGLVR